MNRKYLFLGIALTLIIALPLTIAAVSQSQTIHVNGNAKYPHNLPPQASPTPTPTPTNTAATPTVQFSLFFPNGTALPTQANGALSAAINTVVVDPMTGHNGGWTATCIVIRNDGTAPITVDAAIANKNAPPNIDLTLNSGHYGTIAGSIGADKATNQQPIQPGQYYYMSLLAFLAPKTADYAPDGTFSYSYDVVVTATQA